MSQAAPTQPAGQAVAAYDERPYFARALDYGLKNGIIDSEKLDAMRTEGAKGVVQIADYFGTAHLRTDLDDAVKRMVYLASLYLEHLSDGNLPRAARSLQENSFLSHSRGGSQMLKTLFAMPTDSTIQEPDDSDDVKAFLRSRTLGDQWSVTQYRARFAESRARKEEIEAALWFAEVMALPAQALMGESAESVLHACLLTRMAGRMQGGLLNAQELKDFLKTFRRAGRKSLASDALLEDVPDAHRAAIERHLTGMVRKDLPRILDTEVAFNDLVREYHDIFHPFSLSIEVSDYDTMVTDEWHKVTQGMTDSDSMNTIFLCLAAGMPPKPAITAAEAKAAILAIRDNGTAVKNVQDFILRSAPHQMIDGLLSLWQDEFYPEIIDVVILENLEDTPESVIHILEEHCHIRSAPKKPPLKKVTTGKTPTKTSPSTKNLPKNTVARASPKQKATPRKTRKP